MIPLIARETALDGLLKKRYGGIFLAIFTLPFQNYLSKEVHINTAAFVNPFDLILTVNMVERVLNTITRRCMTVEMRFPFPVRVKFNVCIEVEEVG